MNEQPAEETVVPVRLKTLMCIETVLRLYWSPERFDADMRALEWLVDNQLIIRRSQWWEVTERGTVYVEALRAVPLPEQFTEWRIPK